MKITTGIAASTLCMVLACAGKKSEPMERQASPVEKPRTIELANASHFGEPMKIPAEETTCIKKVFADRTNYDGKLLRIGGRVDSVCAKKGCWMRLTDDTASETLFIKFTCPIQGRLIPMDAVGKQAVVEGTLEVANMSEAEARHYKEDAGAPPAEINKIVGPQKVIRMRSAGALIENRPA